jgi:hypothetical protein
MDETPLEAARLAMEAAEASGSEASDGASGLAAPAAASARLRFFARLADTELFLLIEDDEAEGDAIRPQVYAVEEGQIVLAFDSEARMGAFLGAPAPYAALPGRGLAAWLSGLGVGLGVNLTPEGAGTLLPAEAVEWLATTLQDGAIPEVRDDLRAEALEPPHGLPEALLPALEAKLARAGGLAQAAVLAGVRYAGGGRGHLLALLAPVPGAETALVRAVQEALVFSGVEAGSLDVVFPEAGSALAQRLDAVGLRIALPPRPEVARPAGPQPPGTDPNRPPRLK